MAKLVLGKNKTIVVPAIVKTVGGITPSGTKTIVTNGVHDVTNYANASVNVPNSTETKTITQNGTYTPTSPNIGFSSVTVNVSSGTPVINSLNVTPTTSAQTITPSSGVDGFAPVNVAAVTSSIDANIAPENIKSGVSILGVNGSATILNGTTQTITPTTSAQTVTPTSPYNGFTSVSVPAVTAAIDANIVAGNIKKDVTILGVTGSYEGTSHIGWIQKDKVGTELYRSNNLPDLTGITSLMDHCFYYAFAYSAIETVDWRNLQSLDEYAMYGAFYADRSLKSVNLSGLTEIGYNALRNAFDDCIYLESIDLSGLVTAGRGALEYMFNGCWKSLTSVSFNSLTNVGDETLWGTFSGCYALKHVYFHALTTSSFGSHTNTFSDLVYNVANCTIHFPSNLQSTISGLGGYPNFGGTNTTLLFDLPATS